MTNADTNESQPSSTSYDGFKQQMIELAGISADDTDNMSYDVVKDLEETTNRRTEIMIEQTQAALPIILGKLDLLMSNYSFNYDNLKIRHIKVNPSDVLLNQFRTSLCDGKTMKTLTKQIEQTSPESRPKNFKKILRKQKDRKIACDLGAQCVDSQFSKICEKIVPMIEQMVPHYLQSKKSDIIKFVKRELVIQFLNTKSHFDNASARCELIKRGFTNGIESVIWTRIFKPLLQESDNFEDFNKGDRKHPALDLTKITQNMKELNEATRSMVKNMHQENSMTIEMINKTRNNNKSNMINRNNANMTNVTNSGNSRRRSEQCQVSGDGSIIVHDDSNTLTFNLKLDTCQNGAYLQKFINTVMIPTIQRYTKNGLERAFAYVGQYEIKPNVNGNNHDKNKNSENNRNNGNNNIVSTTSNSGNSVNTITPILRSCQMTNSPATCSVSSNYSPMRKSPMQGSLQQARFDPIGSNCSPLNITFPGIHCNHENDSNHQCHISSHKNRINSQNNSNKQGKQGKEENNRDGFKIENVAVDSFVPALGVDELFLQQPLPPSFTGSNNLPPIPSCSRNNDIDIKAPTTFHVGSSLRPLKQQLHNHDSSQSRQQHQQQHQQQHPDQDQQEQRKVQQKQYQQEQSNHLNQLNQLNQLKQLQQLQQLEKVRQLQQLYMHQLQNEHENFANNSLMQLGNVGNIVISNLNNDMTNTNSNASDNSVSSSISGDTNRIINSNMTRNVNVKCENGEYMPFESNTNDNITIEQLKHIVPLIFNNSNTNSCNNKGNLKM